MIDWCLKIDKRILDLAKYCFFVYVLLNVMFLSEVKKFVFTICEIFMKLQIYRMDSLPKEIPHPLSAKISTQNDAVQQDASDEFLISSEQEVYLVLYVTHKHFFL